MFHYENAIHICTNPQSCLIKNIKHSRMQRQKIKNLIDSIFDPVIEYGDLRRNVWWWLSVWWRNGWFSTRFSTIHKDGRWRNVFVHIFVVCEHNNICTQCLVVYSYVYLLYWNYCKWVVIGVVSRPSEW